MRSIGLAFVLAASTPYIAHAAEWRVVGAPGEAVFALTTLAVPKKNTSWTFQCEADTVAVMQTGVTELLDLQTGRKIPDEGGAITPGASLMGLMVDKADTGMLQAAARQGASGGWDMMIRLPKGDRTLGKLPKAKMVVLMTTGFTAAVSVSPDDRATIADFLDRCKKA